MSKIKSGLWIAASLFILSTVKAQSLEDGKKMFFYGKYKSAKTIFNKINNADATYWLGQIAIANGDIAGAKAIYQQALTTASNNPLLIVGMGHVELAEGKTQEARQRFETAISLSNGKNAAVLNAIGFANVDIKEGDAAYAIEKLKQATALKGMKDPDVYINLGDAYRRISEGGNAQLSYQGALNLNKNYAIASYKIGKIYQTQGINQEDIYLPKYEESIAMDPAFPVVYYNLYRYYYETDINKAETYLAKYLEAQGTDEENSCYYTAAMKLAAKKFSEAITESDKCIATSATPYPYIYQVKALAYFNMNDSVNAKTAFEIYFSKQNPDKIVGQDYDKYARTLLKLPGNDSVAAIYFDKAVAADTTEAGKVALLKTAATTYEAQKKYKDAAKWYNKLLAVKKSPNRNDLYNAADNSFRSGDYATAVAVFTQYTQKYPEETYGFYTLGKYSRALDTSMVLGLAFAPLEKTIQLGELDTAKNKSYLIYSYKYMVEYYVNIKKDKATAIAYCDKILLLEPTNTEAISNKAAIGSMKMTPTTPVQTTPTAPRPEIKPETPKVPITKAVPKKAAPKKKTK
ncbi:tetratricopeptide repeat protein [Ferruginibacter sp. SUN002]|uniref:tetratricopeptide repeat protein n=1 Tax=Ferruginibacter sp. SUN002 TaxID=2937789 RepID=UPI003D35E5D7